MLEILIVWNLAKRIGENAAKKGHKALNYQIVLVGFWILGELTGGIGGMIVTYLMNGDEDFPVIAYIMGLAGAGIGAAIAFLIVKLLTDRSAQPQLSELSPFEPPLPPTQSPYNE